jgi:peptidoglycan/LPS O-acetylase OafA/YrhL
MRIPMLNNLTFARFIAALLIVFHHSATILRDPAYVASEPLRQFFGNGYAGVTFFFILSGFVICASSFDKLRIPTVDAALSYFLKRIIRIVPIWFFLSFLIVLPAFFANPVPASAVRYLTFTQAWSADVTIAFGYLGVSWTLSCEMFFYAMFPLVAFVMGRLCDRYQHADIGLIVFALCVPSVACAIFYIASDSAVVDASATMGPHRWLYRNPALRFSEFLLGVGMFLFFRRKFDWLHAAEHRWVIRGMFLIGISALVVLMSTVSMTAVTLTLAYIPPFAIIVFSLAALEINERGFAIRSSLLILLGESSYALYLCHQQFGIPAFEPLYQSYAPRVGLVWAILMIIALSIGLYKLIEEPSRTWLNRELQRARTYLKRRRHDDTATIRDSLAEYRASDPNSHTDTNTLEITIQARHVP